ncbi:MAG: aromatic compound degradation protein PaaI [Phenylobacterium sp.]|nr:aromatic compound degradation protein PaaI [Phenylobacterium sp.]
MPERTYSWTSLDAPGNGRGDLSGLEYFRAMMNGDLPQQPVTETIGWRISHVEPGCAHMQLTPQEFHLHGGGVVHGGILATLMDSAMAAAILTRLEKGQTVSTIQFGMNNIRRVKTGEGDITAEGRVNHIGRRTVTASATIRSADGQLVAEATSTCIML